MTSKQQNYAASFFSITTSTIGGTIIGGLPGGLIGFSVSLVDEYLLHNNYTDKHYLSLSTYWHAIAGRQLNNLALGLINYGAVVATYTPLKPFGHSTKLAGYLLYASAYPSSAALTYLTDDFLDFRQKLGTPLESFLILNQLFDKNQTLSMQEANRIWEVAKVNPTQALSIIKEDAIELYNNPFLQLFTTVFTINLGYLAANQVFISYFAQYSGNLMLVNIANRINKDLNFNQAALLAGKILLSFFLKSLVDGFVSEHTSKLAYDQFNLLMTESSEIMLSDNNGRKVLAHGRGKELNLNFMQDLWMLNKNGVNKLQSTVQEVSISLFALQTTQKFAIPLHGLHILTLIPQHYFFQKIAQETKTLVRSITEADEKIWDVRIDVRENVEQIILRDGEEYIGKKYTGLNSEQQRYETQQKELSTRNTLVTNTIGYTHTFFSVLAVSKPFNGINIANIPFISSQSSTLYSFYSTNLNFDIQSNDIYISLERLNIIFSIINQPDTNHASKTTNSDNVISFLNYTLTWDGKPLVYMENFNLSLNKTYAVTGKSGCGKSSTLIDMKSGVYGALSSNGTISLPQVDGQQASIMFFNQKLYLPKGATLLETIYFPASLDDLTPDALVKVKDRIIELLKEIEIDEFINDPTNTQGVIARLNSKEFKLSGGQEKKIAIIQAILSPAHIYIFDETFTGLDKKSIILVQDMLNKYLPNLSMLIVDHHAGENNFNSFYDLEVRFADGAVTMQEIAAISPDSLATRETSTDQSAETSISAIGEIIY